MGQSGSKGSKKGGSQKQKKMTEAYATHLMKTNKVAVTPYVERDQNPPVQMQRSRSPGMNQPTSQQNLGRSAVIRGGMERSERFDRPPMMQSTVSAGTSIRRASPGLGRRDPLDNRNNEDALSQALSRALGTDMGEFSRFSTRRDLTENSLFTSRRGGSRDTSPELKEREPSMILSRGFRDYTPPRTNENSFTSNRAARLNERKFSNEENRFTEKEVAKLKLDFALISKNGSVLTEKLIEYLGLEEIEMSPFVERLFTTLQQSFEGRGRSRLGGSLSFGYDNFVRLVAILCKGTANERLDLIYKIFDPQDQGYIMKEDFFDVYSMFFHTMMSVEWRQPGLSDLREQVMLPYILLRLTVYFIATGIR